MSWQDIKVSRFANVNNAMPRNVTIGSILADIQSGKWAKPIATIREIYAEVLAMEGWKEAKEAVKPLKEKLPGFFASGIFSGRNNEDLGEHSGLLGVDLDDLAGHDIEAVRTQLANDKHVAAFLTSPTGNGLKIILRILPDGSLHLRSFLAAREHFRQNYSLPIDEACKNVARLCFVSHDPQLFMRNGDAQILEPLEEPEPEQSTPQDCSDVELTPQLKTRIQLYLKTVRLSIQGDHGNAPAFRVASVLVWGFALSFEDAKPLMRSYSEEKGQPPWSDEEINRMLTSARKPEKQRGRGPRGHLLGESSPPPKVNWEEMDKRRFDMSRLHSKPVAVLKLGGQTISTTGNVTSIFAQAKTGKSAVVGAIISVEITPGLPLGQDHLGWSTDSINSKGHAIIHFDTEQSPYDHEQIVLTALKRAGVEKPPSWLRSYCLTDVGVKERFNFVRHEMERAKKECGGVLSVLLDGVGDLVLDANSIEESSAAVTHFHALAIEFETVVVAVLHENPDSTGKGNAKGRGHLGSFLERKSESVIRLVKDKDDVTNQFAGRGCRHASIPESKGIRFAYNAEKGMHMSAGPKGEKPATEEEREIVEIIFSRPDALGGLNYVDLRRLIMEVEEVSASTAKARIRRFKDCKLIRKNTHDATLYVRGEA